MTGLAGRYAELGGQDATASAVGSAFITLVEPHLGHEHSYNRWYEDDHYYSAGAMAAPWWMAGRRWVATRELRDLRVPQSSPLANPVDAGCYLGTYWISVEHWEDQWAWLGKAVSRLSDADRMFSDRTHVHTAFYDLLGTVRRDPRGPTELHALDHPFNGLVVEVIDAGAEGGQALRSWLLDEHLPAVVPDSQAGLVVAFAPRPWPPGDLWFDAAPTPEGRIALLWFIDCDPRKCWSALFGPEARAGRRGQTVFLAPFIPTVPGTDRYVDELR
jgi:hypothetical protein